MRVFPALLGCLLLAACQTGRAPAPVVATEDAHDVGYVLADAMKKCWFNGDAAFAQYVYAPEVVGGNPRILIVAKSAPGGLPALVIEPKTRAVVEAYGPLMTSPLGPRISADLNRWKTGVSTCA
jgi:hypothetical protein